MGQEISHTGFTAQDHTEFLARLTAETAHLAAAAQAGGLDTGGYRVGFELEAWLLDHGGYPNPVNEPFLKRLDDPWVVPELSRFNVELNGPPVSLGPGALEALQASLAGTWRRCQDTAHGMDAVLAMVGILPNLRPADLDLGNMSAMKRYAVLNRAVQQSRGGTPVHIRIQGDEALDMRHQDVMLEAATTSFQIHFQVPLGLAARAYNASLICCAPLLAAAANSPLLFGRRLWRETRVPLFEQAIELGGYAGLADASVRRVSFGQGYVGKDITELFRQNLDLYPVLLPQVEDTPVDRYAHLRLHNGTIWPWVRPLVGIEDKQPAHIRLEQRVLPSGPSVPDMVANAAFYLGLCQALASRAVAPESRLPFSAARENFYRAARHGLEAELRWLDGALHSARALILDTCLPLAREGLHALGVSAEESEGHLGVVRARVSGGQTGAAWQLANLAREQGDCGRMMANYLDNQRTGLPVHEWNP